MNIKKIFSIALLIITGSILLISQIDTQTNQQKSNISEEILEGKVLSVVSNTASEVNGIAQFQQTLEILVTKGSIKGQKIRVETDDTPTVKSQKYEKGDTLVIDSTIDAQNKTVFYITDYVRRGGLLTLFVLFVILAIGIGHIWGAASLLGMAFSFMVIFTIVLPGIIAGGDAVLFAVIGASLIIPVTFSLSHGLRIKTLIAGIGTILTLVVTGFLSLLFVNLTHLTGFASEEAGFLKAELGDSINMKGILLAGIIIAALGVLDDITISQASVVSELREANPKLSPYEVFTRAMKVGRDHIASLVNTLVLVYTGASLPLLLLFLNKPRPFSEMINYEIVADEVVRMLVGSIGLIVAVPITTALAAYYFRKGH